MEQLVTPKADEDDLFQGLLDFPMDLPMKSHYPCKEQFSIFKEYQEHYQSYQQIIKYQNYLQYKLQRSFFVKRALAQIINDFAQIQEQLYINENDLRLFTFLLKTIDYLSNCQLIKHFHLSSQKVSEERILIPKDTIKVTKIIESHWSRVQDVRKTAFKYLSQINKRYLESVERQIDALEQLFKESKSYQYLQYLLMQLRMQEFPPIKSIKNVFEIFLDQKRRNIYPQVCKNMSKKQVTIFYVLTYLINFFSRQQDQFYNQKDYIKQIRKNLFKQQRQYMINYMFKTIESVILKTIVAEQRQQ